MALVSNQASAQIDPGMYYIVQNGAVAGEIFVADRAPGTQL
jgi:hypothetical protein